MDGHWKDFDEAQQRAFSTAIIHGLDKVEFSVAHQRYEIVFADNVQRNMRTGKTRQVRCIPNESVPSETADEPRVAIAKSAPVRTSSKGPAESPGAEWQVQMNSGQWIDMEAVTNTIINDAKSRGDASVFFRTHGQDIELIFNTMTQKNTKTGKERPVRQKPKIGVPQATAVRSGGAAGANMAGPHPMPAGDSAHPPEDGLEHQAGGSVRGADQAGRVYM
jgi:hypothetical protein